MKLNRIIVVLFLVAACEPNKGVRVPSAGDMGNINIQASSVTHHPDQCPWIDKTFFDKEANPREVKMILQNGTLFFTPLGQSVRAGNHFIINGSAFPYSESKGGQTYFGFCSNRKLIIIINKKLGFVRIQYAFAGQDLEISVFDSQSKTEEVLYLWAYPPA